MEQQADAPIEDVLALHFLRVRLLLVAGVLTLTTFVVVLGIEHGGSDRLYGHLAVGYALVGLLALAAFDRLPFGRRTTDGLPAAFEVLLFVSHLWAGSAVLADYASTADEAFLLMNTLSLMAGAIGLILTASPFARATQLAFLGLFVPSLIATCLRDRWVDGVAVVVFLAMVVGAAIPKINATYRELFDLRQQASTLAERERRRALTDELTGLPNRRGTTERHVEDPAAFEWVLYIDLDRFKAVNDTGGHAVGDAVLIEVAERLVAAAPDGAVVGRMGGDEFVVLIPFGRGDIGDVIGRIECSLGEPIMAGDRPWRIGASIGRAPLRGDRAFETVLQEADEKMFLRKAVRRLEQPATFDAPIGSLGSLDMTGRPG